MILCFTLQFGLAEALWAESQTEGEGYLILVTTHRGLEVVVDGKRAGYISDEPLALVEGTHRVTVRNPRRANWLDEDWVADVRIAAGDTMRVPVIFKISYAINSKPYGASVYVDEEYFGETPVYFKLPETEVKKVRVRKDGYEEAETVVGDSERRYFNIQLQPATPEQGIPAGQGSSAAPDEAQSNTLLYSTVGLMTVAGGLALYFRSQANDRFEKYRSTGNPEDFDRFFNEAERFDRYAAASFIVFQASFIASFYQIIKRANK